MVDRLRPQHLLGPPGSRRGVRHQLATYRRPLEAPHKSAYVYHFVHNVNALGTVDTSVTADTTLYGVFDDGSSKTYVAYNPYAEERTVTFSDGTTLDVPANSLATSNGDVTPGLAPGIGGSGDPGDTTPPSAPTNLSSPAAGTTAIDLTRDAASDGDTGVAEYTAYVDGTATQTVSGTSATVSGLSPDTTYTLAVSATDGAGNESAQSGSIQVTTDAESSGQAPYGGTPTALPGTLEAENYDPGGSGTTLSGSAGSGWSATVTEVATDSYEFAFEPANTAGWPISSSTTAPAGSATAWTTATATTSTPTLATPAASPASTSASSTTTVPPAST